MAHRLRHIIYNYIYVCIGCRCRYKYHEDTLLNFRTQLWRLVSTQEERLWRNILTFVCRCFLYLGLLAAIFEMLNTFIYCTQFNNG